MSGWGPFLIILGLGSFVLNMMGIEFALLMWVDNWGPLVGTAIRIGITALGVVLMVLPRLLAKKE